MVYPLFCPFAQAFEGAELYLVELALRLMFRKAYVKKGVETMLSSLFLATFAGLGVLIYNVLATIVSIF